jgi:hypothetical protein
MKIMTTSRLPAVFAFALASLGVFGVSCTAILAPRDDVQRCGTAEDCDPTGDNRYVPVCKFDDDHLDLDPKEVDKICVADFKSSVNCTPGSYTKPEHPFATAFNELGDFGRYATCTAEQLGSRGCLPMGSSCSEGLAVNDVGLCDDNNPDTPKAVLVDNEELVGQDVLDQFCRSFFCDDRFVCDTTNDNSYVCVPCDADDPYGEGGCGQVWIAGARSCVYDVECEDDPDVTDETVVFGACGG